MCWVRQIKRRGYCSSGEHCQLKFIINLWIVAVSDRFVVLLCILFRPTVLEPFSSIRICSPPCSIWRREREFEMSQFQRWIDALCLGSPLARALLCCLVCSPQLEKEEEEEEEDNHPMGDRSIAGNRTAQGHFRKRVQFHWGSRSVLNAMAIYTLE